MRNIDECKAEVFRRMENGIKERKRKRNRILICCTPLCLGLIVWSAVILPGMLSRESDHAAEDIVMEESTSLVYVQLEIKDNRKFADQNEAITSEERISSIHTVVTGLFEIGANSSLENNDVALNTFDKKLEADEESESVILDYTITFTAKDGAVYIYKLQGNTLFDVNADVAVSLSAEQLDKLRVALGLSE